MKFASALIGALALSALAGCGGEAFNDNIPNIYVGNHSGQWVDVTRNTSGSLQLVIAANGTVTGKLGRTENTTPADITGTCTRSGIIRLTTNFTTDNFVNINGVIFRDASDVLRGSFVYTYRGVEYTATYDFTPPSSSR